MQDWPNYLVRQDFTELGIMLHDVPLGPLNEADQRLLAQILSESGPQGDAGKWNMDEGGTEYCLNGAEVVYNELNNRNLPTFSTFKHALGVRFPERSTGPVGTLYFCWNDPAVTEPAAEE